MASWRKRSNPAEVYRQAVLPLGIFMCVMGVICITLSAVIAEDQLDSDFPELISDPVVIRTFGILWGAVWIVVGVGLCLLVRWAWIAMLVIFTIPALAAPIELFRLAITGEGSIRQFWGYFLIGIPMMLLPIGLYFVTSPVFTGMQTEVDSRSA